MATIRDRVDDSGVGLLRDDSTSRVLLWRRDVTERIERLAPFARFGAPTPMLRDGALWWVSWGYVPHEAFPLVRPLEWRDGNVRYLRAGLVGQSVSRPAKRTSGSPRDTTR